MILKGILIFIVVIVLFYIAAVTLLSQYLQIILFKIHKKNKFINKINPDKSKSLKFITMDLETKVLNGVMIPYCISIFDGKTCTSFYLSDYLNSEEILIASIKYLMFYEHLFLLN
jgi:hypothetical protein